jgi:hypothetical protein
MPKSNNLTKENLTKAGSAQSICNRRPTSCGNVGLLQRQDINTNKLLQLQNRRKLRSQDSAAIEGRDAPTVGQSTTLHRR